MDSTFNRLRKKYGLKPKQQISISYNLRRKSGEKQEIRVIEPVDEDCEAVEVMFCQLKPNAELILNVSIVQSAKRKSRATEDAGHKLKKALEYGMRNVIRSYRKISKYRSHLKKKKRSVQGVDE